jgi:mono/diheme cytochrome c family protein
VECRLPVRRGPRSAVRAGCLAAPLALALIGWHQADRAWAQSDAAPSNQVEFNRDIRPILSDNCFQCHGPDKNQRKADLRFDQQESALADLGGRRAIVPGKPDESELVRRITAADPAERMPPADSGKQLTPDQIDLLRRWIEHGATWQKHWSLIPPVRPNLPDVSDPAWGRNPIDRFIMARLDREGLKPSSEAERITLIRRVTLDLTGLPPTPAEVDAYLADDAPDAYERVVDRLLNSPRYGERMATRWLDGARYADTNGYQSDGERFMWRWRDWVIDAYNANMPFDRFTIEQIAGDLLPNPTLDQLIATGFNRNHRGNAEGGIVPEEYAVEYVVDRVDTTCTVWLGLTMGCARCHDHKFDPLAQTDFYSLYAYFNSVPEKGRAVKYGNSPPLIKAPTRDQQDRLTRLDADLVVARDAYAQLDGEISAVQTAWELSLASPPADGGAIDDGLVGHFALDGDAANRVAAADAAAPQFQAGDAAFLPGRIGQAADFDGQRFVDAGPIADFGFYDKFSCAAWVQPRGEQGGTIISKMTDAHQADGWYVTRTGGNVQVNLVKRWLDDALRVETETDLPADRWTHVLVTYDGSRVATGVQVYFDGRPQPIRAVLDDLNQTFTTKEPLRIGGGGGPEGRFHGAIDDVRVYNAVLSADDARVAAVAESIGEILALPAPQRTVDQAFKLRGWFLARHAPDALRAAWQRVRALEHDRVALIESFPTTMVMQDLPAPREAFVLLRGEYNKPGQPVGRGVPASLSPLPNDAEPNRLGLARWLVDPANPLPARVAVNRFWQMYFGVGLVKTVDDFGSQGEWPSHPELLDWLATEFVARGWDIKAMQRLIVTSATYRQSSKVSAAALHRDPENRLLARGPRTRLSAEMIRDQALAASGLLVERVGGPSVNPYQPGELWKELAGVEYVQGHGEDLYRRGMYTYWKRTVAPPQMTTFDAAGRETCIVRETRTNTPLQALTLMNELTFVEAARVLAERVLREGGPTVEGRIALAFRLTTGRPPRGAELDVLTAGFAEHLARYRAAPEAALALASAGEAPRDASLDAAEVAAYTTVASLLLNLDETITKE